MDTLRHRKATVFACVAFVAGIVMASAVATPVRAQGTTATASLDLEKTLAAARRLTRTLHEFHDGLKSPGIVRTRFYCETMYAAEDMLRQLKKLGESKSIPFGKIIPVHDALADELEEEYDINFEDFGDEFPCPPRVFIPGQGLVLFTLDPFIGPTTPATPSIPPYKQFQVEFRLGGNSTTLPDREFLGTRTGGLDSLGLVKPDKKAYGLNIGGAFRFDTTSVIPPVQIPRLDIFGSGTAFSTYGKIGAFYSNASLSQRFNAIDPGADLLVISPAGGGFVLGANPLNTINDGYYAASMFKFGGNVALGQSARMPTGLTIDTSASVGYSRLQFYEAFRGSITGFARDFAYNSDASVDQLKFRGRLALRNYFPLDNGSILSIGGFGELGPDFSWARGTDMLSFSGFADSVASPSASRTALGYALGTTIGYETPFGLKLELGATYRHETGFPVFMRDGFNPTVLCLTAAEKWEFVFGAKWPFGHGPVRGPDTFVSDVRLKRDIVRLSRLENGLGLYRYRYFWSDTVYVGVMAQEVALIRPDAVVRDASGLLRVDYGKLGLRLRTLDEWKRG